MTALALLFLLAGVVLLKAALSNPYRSLGSIVTGGLDLSGTYKAKKS
jgi:hypothetical protein